MYFLFNDTATTEIYTLSLHDALPIFTVVVGALPIARPQHLAAVLGVPVVGGRTLHRLVAAGGQQREAGGVVPRARGRDADPPGGGGEGHVVDDHEPGGTRGHAPPAGAH